MIISYSIVHAWTIESCFCVDTNHSNDTQFTYSLVGYVREPDVNRHCHAVL